MRILFAASPIIEHLTRAGHYITPPEISRLCLAARWILNGNGRIIHVKPSTVPYQHNRNEQVIRALVPLQTARTARSIATMPDRDDGLSAHAHLVRYSESEVRAINTSVGQLAIKRCAALAPEPTPSRALGQAYFRRLAKVT
jgi:hypothetical protein